MFVCQITGMASAPGEKCHKIVVETRERIYTERYFNDDLQEWEDIEIGRGWEIVKEVNATADGVDAWNSLSDSERSKLAKELMKGGL